jgi:hypothetical protein
VSNTASLRYVTAVDAKPYELYILTQGSKNMHWTVFQSIDGRFLPRSYPNTEDAVIFLGDKRTMSELAAHVWYYNALTPEGIVWFHAGTIFRH